MGMPVTVDVRDAGRERRRPDRRSRGCAGSTRRSAPTTRRARSRSSAAGSSRCAKRIRSCAPCSHAASGCGGAPGATSTCGPAGGSTPRAWSRAGPCSGPAGCSRPRGRGTCASTRAATCSCAAAPRRPRRGAWASAIRTSATGSPPCSPSRTPAWRRPAATSAAPTSSTRTRVAPPAGVASVTVVGPDLAIADAYATAAFAMGADGPAWTAGLAPYEAMTVLSGDRVLSTPGFLRHVAGPSLAASVRA